MLKRYNTSCYRLWFVGILTPLVLVLIASMWLVSAHRSLHGQAQQEQEGDVVLEKRKDFDPPVEITFIQSQIGAIVPGKKLSVNEDWFKGLTVTVRNNSAKPITHISLKVRFPRPKGQENELDYVEPLNYGESPIADKNGQIPINTAKAIMPGESIEIRLSDEVYDIVKMMLKDANYPLKIKNIRVYVSLLGFSDGTIWIGGRIYRLDQNNPGKVIPLEPKPIFSSSINNSTQKFPTNLMMAFWTKASYSAPRPDNGTCYEEILTTTRRDCLGTVTQSTFPYLAARAILRQKKLKSVANPIILAEIALQG